MIYTLYILFFGIWLYNTYNRYGFNASCFILSLYLVGTVNCFLMSIIYPNYITHPDRVTIFSVSIHITLLWLLMYPLIRYINSFRIENFISTEWILKFISGLIIISAIFSFYFSMKDIGRIFTYGNLLTARTASMNGDFTNNLVLNYGIIGYFSSLCLPLSFLAVFLALYMKFCLHRFNGLSTSLLFCSLCYPLNQLVGVGRDGIVFWIFYITFTLILLKQYIDFKRYKKFFFCCGIILIIVFCMLMAISNDRFENSQYGVLHSLMRYGGEQFYLFSYDLKRFFDEGYSNVSELFELFSGKSAETSNLNERIKADYFLNTFSTIAGSIIKRVGFYNTLEIFICGFFIFTFIFKKETKTSIEYPAKTFGMILYADVVIKGFFYFYHYARFIQFTFLLVILIAYLGYKFTTNNNRIIYKPIPPLK